MLAGGCSGRAGYGRAGAGGTGDTTLLKVSDGDSGRRSHEGMYSMHVVATHLMRAEM